MPEGRGDKTMTEIFNKKEKTKLRKKLRHEMTKSETVLWKFIKNSQLGFKFRRQCSINNFVADFYCPEIKLVVEVDGFTHNDERVWNNDRKKDKHFNELGLEIKRYNSE